MIHEKEISSNKILPQRALNLRLQLGSDSLLSQLLRHVLLRGSVRPSYDHAVLVLTKLSKSFCCWTFLYLCSKASNANIVIIAILCVCEKLDCNYYAYSSS